MKKNIYSYIKVFVYWFIFLLWAIFAVWAVNLATVSNWDKLSAENWNQVISWINNININDTNKTAIKVVMTSNQVISDNTFSVV